MTKDGWLMLVSHCKDPSQTITKGTSKQSSHLAGPMWYGVSSHPATPLGMAQCD